MVDIIHPVEHSSLDRHSRAIGATVGGGAAGLVKGGIKGGFLGAAALALTCGAAVALVGSFFALPAAGIAAVGTLAALGGGVVGYGGGSVGGAIYGLLHGQSSGRKHVLDRIDNEQIAYNIVKAQEAQMTQQKQDVVALASRPPIVVADASSQTHTGHADAVLQKRMELAEAQPQRA